MYELENKVATEKLTDITSDERIHRAQGIGLFYTQLVHGISPILTHYVSSVSSRHSVVVFVSIKSLPIGKVSPEERFLFERVKPKEMIFRCIVRHGYKDSRKEQETFEEMLVNQLKEFVRNEDGEEMQREVTLIDHAQRDGVVYLMGKSLVMAKDGSKLVKKLTIDCLYNWLIKQNFGEFLSNNIGRKFLV
ncbi:hypothetical protein GH714_029352 [Hevea brasiliensis]|uniref:K+ potassium transporter C-terminal domain-containing protein n=1 Tax=Hevea brasiliensis TaxID=3981 RepID=A0A6A6KK86_HEVBR|nr:hypothetical protein GH714_029352 [Hevea brasiliensis]